MCIRDRVAPGATLVAVKMPGFGSGPGHFPDFVNRRHHHRTKRRYSAVIQPSPVHRDPEKAGCAQRFNPRIQFFQMATEPFFPIINTCLLYTSRCV